MKIKYLDGRRFYRGLQVGSQAVISYQNYLNKINVFPVADADTGINLAMTMKAILQHSRIGSSIQETLRSVADSALSGARGNSGIIFAQYLHGLSHELPEKGVLSARNFAISAKRAVKHLYDSLLDPVEGTMITVIREWAEYLEEHSNHNPDFAQLLTSSLAVARKSLAETPVKLKVLAEAGVVDAGASGFVYFLEGVVDFMHKGSIRQIAQNSAVVTETLSSERHLEAPGKFRYCTEAILSDCKMAVAELKELLATNGDSLILAGGREKLHIHIHCNAPEQVFELLFTLGEVSGAKVDDMLRQYQVVHARKFPIALVTDTACDLPQEILDYHQILQIPFGINFGQRYYLDKLTILPDQFYRLLRQDKAHPISSQPSPSTVWNILDFAAENYQELITLHISDKLSGVFQSSSALAAKLGKDRIAVLNSRHLSVSEGLIALRIAKAIEAGTSFAEIQVQAEGWIERTRIFTDINTLKYMVRGGRVKPLAGFIAAILNLKPIVSLDSSGKAQAYGKSFSRKSNMRKILAIIKAQSHGQKVWEYAIVHAEAESRARQYAEALTAITGKKPAYIMPLSPVVGVHNGIGAVGIGISYE